MFANPETRFYLLAIFIRDNKDKYLLKTSKRLAIKRVFYIKMKL